MLGRSEGYLSGICVYVYTICDLYIINEGGSEARKERDIALFLGTSITTKIFYYYDTSV
jgi:hypothetical protein